MPGAKAEELLKFYEQPRQGQGRRRSSTGSDGVGHSTNGGGNGGKGALTRAGSHGKAYLNGQAYESIYLSMSGTSRWKMKLTAGCKVCAHLACATFKSPDAWADRGLASCVPALWFAHVRWNTCPR
jgi:hypothetical protein